MSHADAFFDTVASGRENTVEQWHAYLEYFHAALPEANELFTYLRRGNGETSYAVVAQAAAAARPSAVLDIGCGDGNLIEELIDHVPGSSITALDSSQAELDIAKRRYGQAGATFIRGDARALPYPDASFDCVISHQTLNFFPDIETPLREAARVLAPGGTFIFAANRGFRNYQMANWQRLNAAALGAIAKRYPSFKWPKMGDQRAYYEDGLRQLFQPPLWDSGSLTLFSFNVSALTTPLHVMAIFSRLYLYATIPDKTEILQAVRARADELALGEFVDIELPFRVTTVRRAR